MFSVSLQRAGHVRAYSVCARGGAGWEVKREEDRTLTRHVWYQDWHRVERTVALFRQEVDELMAEGWQVQSPSFRLVTPSSPPR